MDCKSKNPRPPGDGFTLIELLVAISILAVVAVLGWRGLDGIVRARVALAANMEQTRRMQLTFAQLQSDCAQTATVAMLGGKQALMAADGRLTLRRTIDADSQPLLFEVVSYRLVDGTLTRRESMPTRDMRLLDQMWNAALTDADSGRAGAVILQSDVAVMSMRVWQDGGWMPAADADLSAVTPGGIEVQLKTIGHETGIVKALLVGAA